MSAVTQALADAYAVGYREALKDAQEAIERRYRELGSPAQDWPLFVMADLVDDANPETVVTAEILEEME